MAETFWESESFWLAKNFWVRGTEKNYKSVPNEIEFAVANNNFLIDAANSVRWRESICVGVTFWEAESFWVSKTFWVVETFWVAESFWVAKSICVQG